MRLNDWLTRAAVGPHLSYRAVRTRLTLIYGGLFVLSGAALMAIAYLLLVNAGFVFSLQGGSTVSTGPQIVLPAGQGVRPGFPQAGVHTHPSAATMAYWRGVARCMRRHGVAFPNPTNVVPRRSGSFKALSNRDGAILAFGPGVDLQSASFTAAANDCGYYADSSEQLTQEDTARAQVREQLLLRSGIALAGMSLLSLGLGWFIAGRGLQPLEAAHALQRQFVANASHELRAPLTRQRALIQVALANPDADQATLRSAHERVLASEEQLEQLINGLLTLTRGQQAGLEQRENLDLAVITSEVLLAHESDVRALGLTVDAALAAAPVQGDRRLIERLLANLIANAIRHNNPGGHVQVIAGVRERAPFASVRNTGPLVGADDVERLLRPFERMGTARTAHGGGYGLGLSIVRAIADAHRAKLHVSPMPRGGLLVEVVFPVKRARWWLSSAGASVRRRAPPTTFGPDLSASEPGVGPMYRRRRPWW